MPSCVAFTENERLIGTAAKNQERSNARNTITGTYRPYAKALVCAVFVTFSGIKRLMGRKVDHEKVGQAVPHLSYKVIEGPNRQAHVEVNYLGNIERLAPEEISAYVSLVNRLVLDLTLLLHAHFWAFLG